MTTGFEARATALGNWAFSAAGIAACKAATEFAQRLSLNVTSSEVCAIVVAAHEAEVASRYPGGEPS